MADDFGNGDDLDLPVGRDAVNRLIKENSDIFSDTHCKVCSAVLISESQKLAHYQSKKHANKYRRYRSIHQGEDFTPAKRMKAEEPEQAPIDETDRTKCCPVCNMTFSSPVVANSHYNGKIHAKNLKLKEQGGVPQGMPMPPVVPRVAKPVRVPPGTFDKLDPDKFCQLCNATFNNPHMAEQHYKGKKHEKQETKSRLMSIYSSSGKTLPLTTPQTAGSGATGNWFRCDTCNVVLNSIEQYQAHISGSKHKNNLEAMIATHSDNLMLSPTRKSFGSALSSNFQPSSGTHSTVPPFSSSAGGLLSSGGYSSMPGTFSSSSRGLSSARSTVSRGGLLPLPSYVPETNDGYNYFSQGY